METSQSHVFTPKWKFGLTPPNPTRLPGVTAAGSALVKQSGKVLCVPARGHRHISWGSHGLVLFGGRARFGLGVCV